MEWTPAKMPSERYSISAAFCINKHLLNLLCGNKPIMAISSVYLFVNEPYSRTSIIQSPLGSGP